MKKVKNTIPVFDIYSLSDRKQLQDDLIAEPFGAYLKVHPRLHQPHRHSFYHLVLFTKGIGTHTIDFEEFTIEEGQVYFMIPGQVHSWNFEGEVDGYVINFSESLFHEFLYKRDYLEQFHFFRGAAIDSVINLTGDLLMESVSIFKQVVEEAKDRSQLDKDMVCTRLITFFISVHRELTHDGPKQIPQQNQALLYRFRKLIDQYFTEKHLPKEYAALLFVTPNNLNAICKELSGKPAGELIRDRILLESKRLLINADINIAEIGYQLNFTDNSYFTRFFKKYAGVTPDQFRKSSIKL